MPPRPTPLPGETPPWPQALHQRWVQAALLVGFWTLVGLIYTGGVYLNRLHTGEPLTVSGLVWNVVGWYSWIPSTLIVIWLVRRFPIRPGTWYYLVPLHTVSAVLNSLLGAFIYASMRWTEALVLGLPDFAYLATVRGYFAFNVGLDSLLYLMIATAVYAFDYYRKYRHRELRTSQLQTALVEAQLQVLRMQLQPHFLFNTFNTIAMLVRQQRHDAAVDTIAQLSDLLRYVLDHARTQTVPLEREVAVLKSYLAIEQIRFGDRLETRVEIDPAAQEALVPSLLLQPMVENAIRHGIAPAGRPGLVTVTVQRRADHLRLAVRDNGVGPPTDRTVEDAPGIGLATTKARLEHLYGDEHRLTLTPAPDGGAVLTVVIPFQPTSTRTPSSRTPDSPVFVP